MSWRPGHLRGLVHRLLLDDTGELAAVVLEADGSGWIAAAPADLAPLAPATSTEGGIVAEPEILNVPDAEAIAHFRAKGFHIGYDWRAQGPLYVGGVGCDHPTAEFRVGDHHLLVVKILPVPRAVVPPGKIGPTAVPQFIVKLVGEDERDEGLQVLAL